MANVVLFVLGVLLIILGFALGILNTEEYKAKCKEYNTKYHLYKEGELVPAPPKKPKQIKRSVFIFIGCLGIIGSVSFTIIPTGYTGVKTTFGQISSESLENGFNPHAPIVQSIKTVNNKQQDISFEDEIWSETSARTPVYYKNITVTYTINPEYSTWIYANVSDYKNNLISAGVVGSSLKAVSKTLSDEDSTNRDKIEPLAAQYLQKSLNSKYDKGVVYINKVVIGDADFEESYNKALAKKQRAQIAKEKQDIENEKNIAQAQAEAEAKIKKAEGKAEAKKIEADAEAEANKKVSDSLSPEILQRMFYEKWDGKLPYSMGGSTNIMDITGMIEDTQR